MKNILFLLLLLGVGYTQAQDSVDPCNIYDLTVLLDESGSVENDFAVACFGLASFYDGLNISPTTVWASFVTFNNKAHVIQHLQGTKEHLVNSAEFLAQNNKPSGGTNLHAGLYGCYDLLLSEGRQDLSIHKICIVISDGEADDGSENDVLDLALLMKQNGITIFVVAIGGGGDGKGFPLLRKMASSEGHVSYSDENLAKTLSEINLCL
jgi:uncharacterized protein YegL